MLLFHLIIFLDYKRTSMAASIEVFEQFVKKLEKSWRGKLIEESGKSPGPFVMIKICL